ncbi:unnamed protein product [Candida verbasci]|uniref:DASH complex subunit DAD2 n=1 Tax=Candida verbasci TaxID=1227364 RepID=A0A9W4TUL3_9ASCO|nr:unnamed protein product [Candida verbasci]
MSRSIYSKIAEKRANLELLREFKELTNELLAELEFIGSNLEVVQDGTSSVAIVLSNWQNVIQNIQLASLGLIKQQQSGEKYPEPLVRINLNNDGENDKSQEDIEQHENEEDDEEEEEVSENET